MLPLVVCSRTADYEAVGKRSRLPGAIRIEPLTLEQVQHRLARGGSRLDALRQTLDEDPKRWALLDTPLMLSIFTLASLSVVLSAAMLDWEWLESSPMARVRALPEPRGRVRYLSDAERPRLLLVVQASHEPALAVVVLLAIATGARKGELLGLRWRDVDWARQQLVFHHTKNHERKTVPVRGEAWTQLVAWAGGVARIGPDWVFLRADGTKTLDIRYAWEQARARAGLEDFRFHDLRHSTASYLAMSGASLVEIAEVLGHKTLQMVRRYAHLSEAHTAGVVERMVGRFLE